MPVTAVKPPGIASPYAARVRLNIQVGAAPAVRLEARDLRLVADIDLPDDYIHPGALKHYKENIVSL